MRHLYVSVRWAATVVAVAATAGCMSIGDDGSGGPAPAKSAGGRSGAAAPDGGTVTPGGDTGGRRDADGKGKGKKDGKGKKGDGKDGGKGDAADGPGEDDASPGAKPPRASDAAATAAPTKNGRPTPTRTKPGPRPTRTTPQPDPTPEPPSPTPEPPSPEPSSSAHGEAAGPAGQGEPSPEAGPA
ncbi:hypothetical protein [Streptomyces sp. NPDC059063]|uniref:hypothetical protein n=1 Tax=unclassified Streptomyces TaxID=2593676 RepID=UPI0036BBEFC1